MDLVVNLVLFIGMAAGLAIIPFGLPGIGVIFGSALLYALLTQFSNGISLNLILVLGALTLFGETADNWLMAAGAKRFGASTTAAWLSLLGGFLGALILGPISSGSIECYRTRGRCFSGSIHFRGSLRTPPEAELA